MTVAALYGQVAAALLVGAAVTRLPGRFSRGAGMIMVPLAGLVTIPVAGWTLAALVHGLLGPPSFTLTQLALLRLARPGWSASRDRSLSGILVAIGVVFYPLALGFGPFDPFDLGYRPLPLLPLVAVLGAWLFWRRQHAWLIVLGFDLAAYAVGLFDNLWNALFDPVLVVFAAVGLLRGLVIAHYRRIRAKGAGRAAPHRLVG
jgi:hypothetical protein